MIYLQSALHEKREMSKRECYIERVIYAWGMRKWKYSYEKYDSINKLRVANLAMFENCFCL